MNVETLAIESEELLTAHQADSASEQTPEITTLALESFKFVGGGSVSSSASGEFPAHAVGGALCSLAL